MKKVAFYALGCKVNQYETNAMEKIFTDGGYGQKGTSPFVLADIVNINLYLLFNLFSAFLIFEMISEILRPLQWKNEEYSIKW